MDGVTAALAYSLFLSIIYRGIARVFSNRLSSVGGFTLTYLMAIYIPIYASLARIAPPALFPLLLFQAFSATYFFVSSKDRAEDIVATINIYISTALSAFLLIVKISRILQL